MPQSSATLHPHPTRHLLLWAPLFVGLFTLSTPIQQACASEAPCKKSFRQKRYVQAGRCYQALYRKSRRPAHLMNAAQSFRIAASNQLSRPHAAYLRELAAKALHRYTLLVPNENDWTKKLIRLLEEKIGYATLVIQSKDSSATFTIEGFMLSIHGNPPFKRRLRPGLYKITISRFGESLQLRLLLVSGELRRVGDRAKDNSTLLRDKTSLPPQQPLPVFLPWTIAGLSIAFLTTGGIFAGLSFANHSLARDKTTPPDLAESAYQTARWQTPAGWFLLGAGSLAGAGAISLFLHPKTSPTSKKLSSPNTHP